MAASSQLQLHTFENHKLAKERELQQVSDKNTYSSLDEQKIHFIILQK